MGSTSKRGNGQKFDRYVKAPTVESAISDVCFHTSVKAKRRKMAGKIQSTLQCISCRMTGHKEAHGPRGATELTRTTWLI